MRSDLTDGCWPRLATGTPRALSKQRRAETLEQAFISFLEEQRGRESRSRCKKQLVEISYEADQDTSKSSSFSPVACLAYAIRDAWNCCATRSGSPLGLAGSALLMLIFGFGISTDVDNLSFAVLDRDRTPESRAYIQEFTGSRYFTEKRTIRDYADLDRRLRMATSGPRSRSLPNLAVT